MEHITNFPVASYDSLVLMDVRLTQDNGGFSEAYASKRFSCGK